MTRIHNWDDWNSFAILPLNFFVSFFQDSRTDLFVTEEYSSVARYTSEQFLGVIFLFFMIGCVI
jgi:hypothetical protein